MRKRHSLSTSNGENVHAENVPQQRCNPGTCSANESETLLLKTRKLADKPECGKEKSCCHLSILSSVPAWRFNYSKNGDRASTNFPENVALCIRSQCGIARENNPRMLSSVGASDAHHSRLILATRIKAYAFSAMLVFSFVLRSVDLFYCVIMHQQAQSYIAGG